MILEAAPGGRFLERSAAGEEAVLGEVVRFERPHRITYTWYPGARNEPTEVDVRFRVDGEHTAVEVVHSEGTSGLGDEWPSRARRFERAWGEVLPAFADFAERT